MHEPLPKKIHCKLRARLASGSLPPGSRLDYKSLAREFGVSTTPVREAVSKLASEGFVELVPRLGAVVRSLSRTAAEELFEVREALECFAAAKAATILSPRHMYLLKMHQETMLQIIDGHDGNEYLTHDQTNRFVASDLAFHQTILAGARNGSLSRILDESLGQLRLFLHSIKMNKIALLVISCEQHGQIIDALEAHDANRATNVLQNHIRRTLQNTLDHLDVLQGDGFPAHHAEALR